MRETWYQLEDGTAADPNDCAPDDKGVLRHASGASVAMRGNAYASIGVDDPDAERSKTRDMKPEKPKRGYKTRESKAED